MIGSQRRTSKGVKSIYCFFLLVGIVWIYGLCSFLTSNIVAERIRTDSSVTVRVKVEEEVKVDEALSSKQKTEKSVQMTLLKLYSRRNCLESSLAAEIEDTQDEFTNLCSKGYKSAKLEGTSLRIVDVFSSCTHPSDENYAASIYVLDGCVNLYNYPKIASIKFADSNLDQTQIGDGVKAAQRFQQKGDGKMQPRTRVIFSCESSEYFGYQVWANFYGFVTSGQSSASWTRLLTARKRDDLSEHLPGLATFQAKRHLYSHRYSPINKADVIEKFFASADSPKEEVMVVIDPDNWLLKDVDPWVRRVTRGHALGEAAYYHGSSTAQKLWRKLCEENCEAEMDLVGVPYVVHREDLRAIAPLWKSYSLKIKESLEKDSPGKVSFEEEFSKLDVNWAAEMFGYNMAAAHLGVKHAVVHRMQVRDVAGTRRFDQLSEVAMLHMGRAWFPKHSEEAKKFAHTEGKSFSRFGQQVWCKCNFTASTIFPWPVPEGTDFQSTHTLRLLHDSEERFGPVPENSEYRRKKNLERDYHWRMP